MPDAKRSEVAPSIVEWEPYLRAWRQRLEAEEQARQEREFAVHAAAERAALGLVNRFGVDRVYLFGSLAGHASAPFGPHSDVDLAVEGLAAERYWAALAAVEKEIPVDVAIDLVRLEDAVPSLVERVRSTGVVLADGAEIRGDRRRPGE